MDSGPTSWFSHNCSAFRNLTLGSSAPVRRGGSFKLRNRTQTSWSFAHICKHSWATYRITFLLVCQLLQTWPMLYTEHFSKKKTHLTSWKIDSCSSRIKTFWFYCQSSRLDPGPMVVTFLLPACPCWLPSCLLSYRYFPYQHSTNFPS